MKKISFKNFNRVKFIDYINRIISVDKFVAITIEDGVMSAVPFTADHTVVKSVSCNVEDVFGGEFGVDGKFKMLFNNGNRIVEMLNTFDNENIKLEIKYEEVDDVFVANTVTFSDSDFRFNFPCFDQRLDGGEITPEQCEAVFSDDEMLLSFNMNADTMGKITKLITLGKDKDTFHIYLKDGAVGICEYRDSDNEDEVYNKTLVSIDDDCEDFDIEISKKSITYLDKVASTVKVFGEKIIFCSDEDDTKLCLGVMDNEEE